MLEASDIDNNQIERTKKAPEILDHLTISKEPPNISLACT